MSETTALLKEHKQPAGDHPSPEETVAEAEITSGGLKYNAVLSLACIVGLWLYFALIIIVPSLALQSDAAPALTAADLLTIYSPAFAICILATAQLASTALCGYRMARNRVTTENVRMRRGLLGCICCCKLRAETVIPLTEISSVTSVQGWLARLCGVETIVMKTSGCWATHMKAVPLSQDLTTVILACKARREQALYGVPRLVNGVALEQMRAAPLPVAALAVDCMERGQ